MRVGSENSERWPPNTGERVEVGVGITVVDREDAEGMVDGKKRDVEARVLDVGRNVEGIDLEIAVDDLGTSRGRVGVPVGLFDVIPTVAIPACPLKTGSNPPCPAPTAPPALPLATTLLHLPSTVAIVPNSRGYKVAYGEIDRDACAISPIRPAK